MFAVCILAWATVGPPAGDEQLTSLVSKYFLATEEAQRRRACDEICAIAGLKCGRLAKSIRAVQLWQPQKTGQYATGIRLGGDAARETQVWLSVPAGYEPHQRRPLIVTYHGQGGQARQMLSFTRQLLNERADDFLIAAPQDIGPLGLTQPVSDVAQPRALLARLRRMFHIDSDHVFVMGYSLGGHNSWMSAMVHADCFAGVMPLATPLQMVGGEALYEEVLPNARNTAVLFCWGELDNLDSQGQPHPEGGNVHLNRRMAEVIRGLGFAHFEGIELPGVGHIGVRPPSESLKVLLSRTRTHAPPHVRQTFRIPEQGRAYWVEVEGFQGEPLPNEKVRIPVSPGQDPLAAERKYLVNRLGVVDATCDSLTITLKGRRAKAIVLRLSDELIDFGKPVRIIRNGQKRFDGRIEPDPRVMLQEAGREWDFDRLATARIVVPLTGKVRIGANTKSSEIPAKR